MGFAPNHLQKQMSSSHMLCRGTACFTFSLL